MEESFTYDVFLSHRSTDAPVVIRIAQRLRDAGLRVWLDEWMIKPGDDIYLAVEKGLEQSRTLVLCVSRAAIESDWVGLERSTALFRDPANRARRFVPLLLEDTPLPDTIGRYRYIDYRREDSAAFAELLGACSPSAAPLTPRTRQSPYLPRPSAGWSLGALLVVTAISSLAIALYFGYATPSHRLGPTELVVVFVACGSVLYLMNQIVRSVVAHHRPLSSSWRWRRGDRA